MKTLSKPVIILLAVTTLACNQKQTEEAASKPNIVIIYMDDLGYGDLSCYGATEINTPNIRITSYNVCYTKLLRDLQLVCNSTELKNTDFCLCMNYGLQIRTSEETIRVWQTNVKRLFPQPVSGRQTLKNCSGSPCPADKR